MALLGNVQGTLIGKVVFANIQQKTTKDGKEYEEFTTGLQLPNGSTVFVTNRIYEKTREVQSLQSRVEFLERIVEDYKNEDIYARLRLKPDDKTGENKYGKFSTFINKNDKLSFTAEGFLDEIEHEVKDDVVYLIFKNQKGDVYNTEFSKFVTDLTIRGYVKQIDDSLVEVVDSDEEYPARWDLTVPAQVANQLKIGQMYGFVVKFVKGDKIQSNVSTNEDIFSFTEEFVVKTNKSEFESDKLQLINGGIISKAAPISFSNIGKSKSTSYSSKVVEDDDSFPF